MHLPRKIPWFQEEGEREMEQSHPLPTQMLSLADIRRARHKFNIDQLNTS